jgi:TonB family protein
MDRRLVTVSLDRTDAGLVIDLSESGMAVQALARVRQGASTAIQFDLPDSKARIEATGVFAWVEEGSGRAGIQFLKLTDAVQFQLKEWLTRARSSAQPTTAPELPAARPDPPALVTLQREIAAQKLPRDAALKLIAERTRDLTRATGVAIAIDDGDGIVCRASAGSAPEIGARLNPSSGLSGECVRTGVVVRCEDTELDPRVDRDACRQLKIRSAVMVPLFTASKVVGLLEVFSATHHAFHGQDVLTLRRLADLITATMAPPAATPVPPEDALVDARRARPPAVSTVAVHEPATIRCDACGHLNPATARDCEHCDLPLRPGAPVPRNASTVSFPRAPESTPVTTPLFTTMLEQPALAATRKVVLRLTPRTRLLVLLTVLLVLAVFAGWQYWQGRAASPPPAQPPVSAQPAIQQEPPPPAQTTTAPVQPPEVKASLTSRDRSQLPPEPVTRVLRKQVPLPVTSTSADQPLNLPSPQPYAPELGEVAAGSSPSVAVAVSPPVVEPSLATRVSSGATPPRLVHKVDPVYPRPALMLRLQGTVVLKATITSQGTVENVRVESGNQVLAGAAVQAVRQWRYQPQLLNGQPVETETTITVSFNGAR